MAEQGVESDILYRVVINHEEQYSIWPEGRDLPLGWNAAGKTGTKADCLAYIEQVWTDMRPLSLRRQMEQQGAEQGVSAPAEDDTPGSPEDDVVTYLSQGDHPIQVTSGSVEQFLERVRSGYVSIKFTDTRGGTELGIRLDSGCGDTARGDGKVHIAGDLALNYQKVRLTAEVALDTLTGFGRLEVIA